MLQAQDRIRGNWGEYRLTETDVEEVESMSRLKLVLLGIDSVE